MRLKPLEQSTRVKFSSQDWLFPNCSLLADDAYVNSVTELLPLWAAERRKELTDHWSVWGWIKYNIRAHAINFSKRKSKERNEKEKTLQEELSKAKEELEMTPSDLNASRYLVAQEKLETFYEEKIGPQCVLGVLCLV